MWKALSECEYRNEYHYEYYYEYEYDLDSFTMQTNVQIDSKNIRNTDDNFRSRSHHITIEVSVSLCLSTYISVSLQLVGLELH